MITQVQINEIKTLIDAVGLKKYRAIRNGLGLECGYRDFTYNQASYVIQAINDILG